MPQDESAIAHIMGEAGASEASTHAARTSSPSMQYVSRRDPGPPPSCCGVQVLLYRNTESREAVVAFRGTEQVGPSCSAVVGTAPSHDASCCTGRLYVSHVNHDRGMVCT
jgi:hypothetical protein